MQNRNQAEAYDERQQMIQDLFSFEGYDVVRKELFAHTFDASMTVKDGFVKFNTAAIKGFEEVVYIQMLFNEKQKRLAIRRCEQFDRDALRWCIVKDDDRKPREMRCQPFTDLLYKVMGWDKEIRYKLMGFRIEYRGETLYVFDFTLPELFRKQQKVDGEKAKLAKGYYESEVADVFGVSVAEHKKQAQLSGLKGYNQVSDMSKNAERSRSSEAV